MSHFYTTDGQPRYEVLGKNGKMRAAHIGDARTNGWLSGVSGILSIIAKPGLDTWKQNEVAISARRIFESGTPLPADPKEWCDLCREKAFEQVNDAADFGTQVHDAVEKYLNRPQDAPKELAELVALIRSTLASHDIEISDHEVIVVNRALGYAGKADGIYTRTLGEKKLRGIIDFKTKRTTPGKPVIPNEDHPAQIAAYLAAHGRPYEEGANVYISTTEPGRIEVVFYDSQTLAREFAVFEAALTIWKIRNKYHPGKENV